MIYKIIKNNSNKYNFFHGFLLQKKEKQNILFISF